jgi:hypothetical protein
MTARCDRCGAPIYRIRPAAGQIGTCADVYAPFGAGLTPEQQREWGDVVAEARDNFGHPRDEIRLWAETLVAVDARLVKLEAVAEAARLARKIINDEQYMDDYGDVYLASDDADRAVVILDAALAALDKDAK